MARFMPCCRVARRVTPPEAGAPPSGENAHFRALEQLYGSAPITRWVRSRLTSPGAGHSIIDFDVDESQFHAAGAVHEGEPLRFFNTGFQMAGISMRSVSWG